MLYKVDEIANICNVSKQAIYDKLKQDKYKAYVRKEKGIKGVTAEGLNLFKEDYCIENLYKEIQEEERETLNNDPIVNQDIKELIEEYKDLIQQYKRTIEYLEKENSRLIDVIEQQNKLILNSQVSEQKALNNTELMLLEKRTELDERKKKHNENNNVNNKNWFGKLFNSKK